LLWRKHSCLSQTGVTEKSKMTGGSSSHCVMGSCKRLALCRLAASFTSKIVGLKNLICISECNGMCKIILKASLLGRCSYD
jgi:hypothetical protein